MDSRNPTGNLPALDDLLFGDDGHLLETIYTDDGLVESVTAVTRQHREVFTLERAHLDEDVIREAESLYRPGDYDLIFRGSDKEIE